MRRKSAVIELTSLLDVIFIMLFMMMGRGQEAALKSMNEAKEMQDSANAEIRQIKEEYSAKEDEYSAKLEELEKREAALESEENNIGALQSRIDGYEEFDKFATIVTIELKTKSDGKREITVTDNKSNKSKSAANTIISDVSSELGNKLGLLLKDNYITNIKDNAPGMVCFMFKYDPAITLVSDRQKIETAIEEMTDKSDKFFYMN